MVLTSEFWINFSKNNTNDQFGEKIIRDDIYINILKQEKSYHRISCSSYKGSDFNTFYENIVTIINQRIQELSIKEPLGLEWSIRPIDMPNNLPDLLMERGYKKLISIHMMGIDLQSYKVDLEINHFKFDIEKVTEEKMFEISLLNLMLRAFPKQFSDTEDVKRKFKIMTMIQEKKGNILENYVVYSKIKYKPIALASLLIRKDIPNIAYLNGATTDEKHRHKGIYSELLFKRIKRCRELGLRYITIDADVSSSGPILQKFGFKTFDVIDIFRLDFN